MEMSSRSMANDATAASNDVKAAVAGDGDDANQQQQEKQPVVLITGCAKGGIGYEYCQAFSALGCRVVATDIPDRVPDLADDLTGMTVLPLDVTSESSIHEAVRRVLSEHGRIDVLVNNAAEQYERPSITEITEADLDRVFRTNIFSYFLVTKYVLPRMGKGGSIINTSSVNAYKGNKTLIDYTSTKGAITAFTRALALQLAEKGIRVNGVAPGPIWTPLIPASFKEEKVGQFGSEVPMKRAGQPAEVAPSFVFLASEQDSSYMSGQMLHVNGGVIVNG